jgi:hypothetical protein
MCVCAEARACLFSSERALVLASARACGGPTELSGSTSAGEFVRETSARSTPASSSTFRCAGCTPYRVAPIDRTSQHVLLHYLATGCTILQRVALSCSGLHYLAQVGCTLAHLARTVRDELPCLQVVGCIAAVPAAVARRGAVARLVHGTFGRTAHRTCADAVKSAAIRIRRTGPADRTEGYW